MDEISDDSFDSSDDDFYTNAVARFKAAKEKEKKRSRKNDRVSSLIADDTPIEIIDTEETTLKETTNESSKESTVESSSVTNNIEIHDTSDSESSSSKDKESDNEDLEITGFTKPTTTNRTDCIVIDPDDNENLSMEADSSKTDLSEYENYNIEIKVLWRSHKLVHLEMKLYEPFENIFKHFEKLENVPIKRILLLRNEKPIKPDDTPASLGISVIDIIEGGVIDMEYSNNQGKGGAEDDENVCKIKVQMSQKQSIVVNLQKDQPFKFVFHQCETHFNISASKIKLYFDGDLINSTDTPESLDLEDEACVDLKVTP